ncbi:hypothetical protein BGZ65_000347, partial [Modicella reniformis]
KKLLCETKAIDSCVLEAILAPRDIDELVNDHEENNESIPNQTAEEGVLDIPCQYPACTPLGVGSVEEQQEGAMAWFDFQREQDAAEDAVSAIEKNPSVSAQTGLTDFERDRATSLASVLDGASFLLKMIDDLKSNDEFMSFFTPATNDTVLLSGALIPSDDEGDMDYCTDSEANLSSIDSNLGDDDGSQENVDETL